MSGSHRTSLKQICPRWGDHKFWPKRGSINGLYECKYCGQTATKSQVEGKL
jgi:hypothetical protein